MLLVHRQGKKHAAGVEWKNREKKELQELILKRKHEQFLKDGSTDIQQAAGLPNNKKLCLGPAYDPRCQKTKAKQPKMKLDLRNSEHTSVPMATSTSQLPGNRYGKNIAKTGNEAALKNTRNDHLSDTLGNSSHNSTSLNRSEVELSENERFDVQSSRSTKKKDNQSAFNMILEKQMEGPVLHSHQLKHLFTKSNDGPIHITPYQSKKPRVHVQIDQSTINSHGINSSERKGTLKFEIQSLINLPQNDLLRNTRLAPPDSTNHSASQKAKDVSEQFKDSHPITVGQENVKITKSQSKAETNVNMSNSEVSQSDLQQKKEKAEKYLQFRGAGWKKDLFGNWVKDEDAEFDSDEEPPDLP